MRLKRLARPSGQSSALMRYRIMAKSRAQSLRLLQWILRQALSLCLSQMPVLSETREFATSLIQTSTSYGSIERSVGSGSAPAAVSIAWICRCGLVVEEFKYKESLWLLDGR